MRDGRVEVRAPFRTPRAEIDSFVASKEAWIARNLAESSERAARRGSFTLGYGDLVTYRGKQYPIVGRQGDLVGFDEKGFFVPMGLTPEQVKNACVHIYRMLAKRDLNNRTIDVALQMHVVPYSIKVNNAKARWGSCSHKRSINFSWRLIMADDEVIDYVIVHELAHIIEPNHSHRFWEVVEGVLPDYAARKARLRDLQHRLGCEDWG